MGKPATLIGLLLLLGGGAWAPLRAEAEPDKDQVYEKKRVESQALNLPLDRLRYNAASYRGQVVELDGKITGMIVSPRSKTFILEASTGGSVFVAHAGDDPLVVSGSLVRVLGRVPRDAVTLTELEFVAIAPPRPQPREPIVTETVLRGTVSPPPSDRPPAPPAPPARGGEPASPPPAATPPRASSAAPAAPALSDNWLEQRIAELKSPYKRVVAHFNRRLSEAQLDQITEAILRFSAAYGVDARLVVAIIAVESSFDPNSTSHKGAMGLGQLMPSTASGLGVKNAYDPIENIAATARLIRGHLEKYKDKPDAFNLALAAYNAGSGAVRRYGGVPPYKETTRYIWKVYNLYKQLAPDMFQ